MKSINIKSLGKAIGMIAIGLFLGWLVFSGDSSSHDNHEHTSLVATWTCSMHPQIRQDKPGQCPICGMDLVEVTSLTVELDDNQIVLNEDAIRLAQIQTTVVGNSAGEKELTLPGKVISDETKLAEITARFAGRIEKLSINFTGQEVSAGTPLATIYSPELVTAQKELFEAVKFKESQPDFYVAAINKLKLWNISDAQISNILKHGKPQYNFNIVAPLSGTVVERKVAVGDYVQQGSPLFKIANLNQVWAVFDAYESDLPWIKANDSISFTSKSLPGKTFDGKISFVDPIMDPDSRTAKVRVEVPNRDKALKLEMLLEGKLKVSSDGSEDITIPKSAVLWTGKRSIVYVKAPGEKGVFTFTEVELGKELGQQYTVINGLKKGDEIVTNGVFKIDAAAQLQGKSSMMNQVSDQNEEIQGLGEVKKIDTDALITQQFENVDPEFKAQLRNVLQAYLTIKNNLVETDFRNAITHLSLLKNNLDGVNMSLVKDQAHRRWMEDLSVFNASLSAMEKATDVEILRNHFSTFSDQLYASLVSFQVDSIKAYRQFCPMAFDNTGGYWLSGSEEILNPYFGDKMLTCGNVDTTLN